MVAPDSGLYVVSTPIGNLSDISKRAVMILQAADIVAVEDSRVTGKLLNHLGLKKRMVRYNDHSGDGARDAILTAALNGVVALVSDAGTPLISDPGYRLVRAARDTGINVVPVPGASAAIAALSVSGLPTDRFLFAGFLPPKQKARAEALAELGTVRATLIFYESSPRLIPTLNDIDIVLPGRELVVAREITKKFEEYKAGSAQELIEYYNAHPPKGEITLLVGPPVEAPVNSAIDLEQAMQEALKSLSPAKAAAEISKRTGIDRSELYALANRLKGKA
jgi:16S rRNA (cytidine1402-2'-O)-methyltransferase